MVTFLIVTNCILNIFFSLVLGLVSAGVIKQKKQLKEKVQNIQKGVKR